MIGEQPRRLVARAMTEFLVSSAQCWARPHDGDLTRALVFCTVLAANLEPLMPDDPIAARAASGEDQKALSNRPISVHAVAGSLSLPYETVRRKIVQMETLGLVRRARTGVTVHAAALRSPAMQTATAEVRALLSGVLRILEAVGVDLRSLGAATNEGEAPPSDALVGWIVATTQVRMLERIAPIFGDVVRAYLFCGVLRANVYDLLVDPAMAWRYATEDALPPDEARKPVTVTELSRQLGIPHETARRHVKQMVAAGYLTAGDHGVVAPTEVVSGDAATHQNAKLSFEFFRMLTALGRVGMFP